MKNNEIKWYMITTIAGKEEQVVESLHNKIIEKQSQADFEDFKVMMVKTLSSKEYLKKMKGEKYKDKRKNLFPGYIFIKMNMTNDAWFLVRNTQYVTGLVGSSGQRTKPTPVSDAEIRRMEKKVDKINSDFSQGIIASPYVSGAIVEIINGPYIGQTVKILESNDEKQMAVVEIEQFGRKTPVTIEYNALEIRD